MSYSKNSDQPGRCSAVGWVLPVALVASACGSSGGDDGSTPSPPQPNLSPSSVIQAEDTYEEDSTFSVDGSGSNDPDGSIATYSWSIDGSNDLELSIEGNDQAIATISVGEIRDNETISLTLVVTDNEGASNSTSRDVLIREIHRELLPPNPGIASLDTLEGVDVDGDEIRDDMEIAIYELYPLDKELRSVMDFGARALQQALVAGASAQGIDEAVDEISRWTSCLVKIRARDDLPIDYATKEIAKIDTLAFNTTQRVAAKFAFERALDGRVLAPVDTNISECRVD